MILFDLQGLKDEMKELEKETVQDGFWNDAQTAKEHFEKFKYLKNKVEKFENINKDIKDINEMLELSEEELTDYADEIISSISKIRKDVNNFKLESLLSGEYDKNNAIVSIHAGAGGTEAQDWASMLYRMYERWAKEEKFDMEILDENRDGEAGFKSITLMIKGMNAYGFLKSEKGIHRLVRISPFDASKRRHTSFAGVEVFPELTDDESIEINPKDLRIDTYRSTGAGGQHVNTTDSAVRITHIPTGVTVQCQNERSQIKNRETAMKMLTAKLMQIADEEKREKIEDIQGKYSQIAWGQQIRSYVFHPYSMVKDHRTGCETGNVQKVLDGEIDEFIDAYLNQNMKK